MKVNIVKPAKPTALQKLFASPAEPAEEAEFKGLMFVEQLLTLMKEQGMNRTQLAEKMGVGKSRVTAMLNGSSNFTLETLIRAGRAVGANLEQTLVPAGMKGRWFVYHEDEIHAAFRTRKQQVHTNPPFQLETDEIATDDDAKSA
jgi:transcriptional regulator with XRE-family HTH domain